MSKKKDAGSTIKVSAKCERFRRAGITFSRTPVELRLDELSKAQLELIENEPMLVVER